MILVSYSWAWPFFLAAQSMTSRASAIVMTVAFSLFLMKDTPVLHLDRQPTAALPAGR